MLEKEGFRRAQGTADGSYLYDGNGTPFLDLQMWYSAVNFGYANKRLNEVLKHQIDTLPQVASQYLHPTKIELAPAKKHRVTASGESCFRPAANRTREAGIRMRVVAMARTISNGSSAGIDASGVPSTRTSILMGTLSGCG